MLRDQGVCFRTESEVCDDDVAAFRKEKLCKAEIDARAGSCDDCCLSFDVHCHGVGGGKEERREEMNEERGVNASSLLTKREFGKEKPSAAHLYTSDSSDLP